ncbi:MAG: hypothetical protein ABIN89_09790 [Chitinophagaceae bacterium]
MQSTIRKRTKYSQDDMYRHVESWQRSGQTGVAYALEHNICKSVLYYWLKKHKNTKDTKPKKSNQFIPIDFRPSNPGSFQGMPPVIEVSLPGGAFIKCYQPVEASFIQSLIY